MQGYICVMIDIDQNKEITKEYGVRAIPTMFMLDSEGKNLGKVQKRDPQGFMEDIKKLTSAK